MVEETKFAAKVINQPAGHVEPGEDILQAAVREAMEETGWAVAINGFLGISSLRSKQSAATYYRLAFTAEPLHFGDTATIDSDIDRVQRMTVDEIRANKHRLRSDMVLNCIEDYLVGRIFPLEIFRNRL